ncbi:MAG: hypothetical protein FWF22_06205, partial [Treponema sp.]|nr:hypothetical protein [Treponema sp.]
MKHKFTCLTALIFVFLAFSLSACIDGPIVETYPDMPNLPEQPELMQQFVIDIADAAHNVNP